MNIVFMGTPDFAVPCLKALIESGENVQAVFTQPDKPKGRGYKLTPPPVKELALKHNIPVYQPVSLKSGEDAEKSLKLLNELAPDLIIVVAYGRILPMTILNLPKKYCINVHASLLPKYRGAGPIQWSVLDGEKETGVTTMLMAEGIDTGDMLLKASTPIGEDETATELHDRLSEMGAKLLLETIKYVKDGTLNPQKQDDSQSNHAPMLTKDMCPLDFRMPAQKVHNQIRGLSAFPCATAVLNGKKLKVYKSTLAKDVKSELPAGSICDTSKLSIVCGDGNVITMLEVQAEGGKRMKATDYLRGNPVTNEMKFEV